MGSIPFPEDKTGPALFQQYLQKRGVLPQTVVDCGLEVCGQTEALDRINYKAKTPYRHYLYIPYPETGYAVIRGLGSTAGTFGELVGSVNKLLAPKGDVQIYSPPNIDWTKFSGTLYVCESAIKAIVLSQYGYAAISGNGVSGVYTNSGFSAGWPADLIDGGGVDRVVILFDANWQTNKKVEAAIRKLATGIHQHHPKVDIIHKQLDLHNGEDQGIDDAVARLGREWLDTWLASDANTEVVEVSALRKHLDELNELYVITHYPAMITDRTHKCRVTRSDFTDMLEADRCFMEKIGSGKGERWVEVSPAKEWLKWDDANKVAKMLYRPGKEELTDHYYNTWQDDGVAAIDGDIAPFLTVYRNAVPDDVERKLLLESMAWIVQNRGTRMEKCFALVGADQGTGKSLIVETLGRVVGDSNFVSISPHNFGNNFNSALVGREVVLLDDLGPNDLKTNSKGLFKNFITGRTTLAEKKGVDAYKVESSAVLFITSNEFGAIPMDAEDRRVHICSFSPTVHHAQGTAWWKEYLSWLQADGYGIIRGWLEGLDLSDFDPNFMPPMTSTKMHMQQSNMHPIESWVEAMYHDPDAELLGNKRSVYTIQELCLLLHGPAWDDMDNGAKSSTEKYMQGYLSKRYRRCGKAAIRTHLGRLRYWGIRVDGTVTTPEQVKADVKKYATLNAT